MFKFMFGQIFNIFTLFKAPIKELGTILFQRIWQKKNVDCSNNTEKN